MAKSIDIPQTSVEVVALEKDSNFDGSSDASSDLEPVKAAPRRKRFIIFGAIATALLVIALALGLGLGLTLSRRDSTSTVSSAQASGSPQSYAVSTSVSGTITVTSIRTASATSSPAASSPTSAASSVSPIRASATGPVIDRNFQDPSVLQLSTGYYAFAGPNGNPDVNVLVASSPDFVNWTVRDDYDALPTLGAWAANPGHLWSPDVNQLSNGKYVMYYSAVVKDNPQGMHCVGAATASTPEGPYTALDTPMFCNLTAGGAIDPDGWHDPILNKQYVVYKVDGNSVGHGGACSNSVEPIAPTPIMIQEVSMDDGITQIGSSIQLITNDASDGPNVEAPALTYNADEQLYYLLYSSNCFVTPLYSIKIATSKNLLGPYTKQSTPFLVTGDTPAKVYVPGAVDFTQDGKKAIFHGDVNMGWFNHDGTKRARAMYAMDLDFSATLVQPGILY